MHYTKTVTDYETGEIHRIGIGDHLTITELANRLQVTRGNLVGLLREMGLVWREYDDVAGHGRYRLRPEAVKKGMGFRILSKDKCPFDVLAPDTVELVEEALPGYLAAIAKDSNVSNAREALDAFNGCRPTKLDKEGRSVGCWTAFLP